jgi:predicted ArsR family transcriptional regulator
VEEQNMTEQTKEAEQPSILPAIRDLHVMYTSQQIALLNALKDKLGPEVATVIEQANSTAVCQRFLTGANGERTIEALIDFLWKPLRPKGYEFTIDPSDEGVQMTCTACPWATLYKNLGGAEWGFHLYCIVDEDLVEAFNPQIGFKRTKTLMEGYDSCDHFYYLKS